ncbi:MAG TPA: hypothetical protein VIK32_08835, partial [Candidatus Limnocylindrales bacterium]
LAAAAQPAVTTGDAVSGDLVEAWHLYKDGKCEGALAILRTVAPEARTDPARAQELLDLASAVRATNDDRLQDECDELIGIALTAFPNLVPRGSSPPRPRVGVVGVPGDERTSGQMAASVIGLLLLIGGLIVAGYFLAFFDVSVDVPYQDLGYGITTGGDRVNNIGLMADRQNGIIFGFAAAIAGGVLMVVGRTRTRPQVASPAVGPAPASGATVKGACNACGGLMDVGVAYCPHCGQKLSWTGVEAPPTAT